MVTSCIDAEPKVDDWGRKMRVTMNIKIRPIVAWIDTADYTFGVGTTAPNP